MVFFISFLLILNYFPSYSVVVVVLLSLNLDRYWFGGRWEIFNCFIITWDQVKFNIWFQKVWLETQFILDWPLQATVQIRVYCPPCWGFLPKGGTGGDPSPQLKILKTPLQSDVPSFFCPSYQKTESPFSFVSPPSCFTIMTYLKKLIEIKSFKTAIK